MAWSSAVITNSGLAILPQLITGSEMILDTAKLASGTVEDASLIAQTSLSSPIDEIPVLIASKSIIENGIAIKLQIRNTGLTSAKTFKQIGLYATYNETQVLFAIAQDDTGEEVPSQTDYPDYMLEFTMAVAVSQTDGITVTVNPSAVVTAGTLDERLAGYTPTEAMNEAIEESYNKSTDYTDLQITLLINGAPATLDTLKELAEAIAEHEDVVEALNAAIGNKSEKGHGHAISDVTDLQTTLDNKAPFSHGTHVTYSTTAPAAAGTASAGSADTVSRSDHVHPMQTDTDTVGGLAPTKFMQGLGVITTGDIKNIALALTHAGGFGLIGNAVTGMPADGTHWFTVIERGNTLHARITATRITTNETYTMTYNSGTTTWSAWIPIAFMGLGTVSSGSIKDYALGCTSTGGTAYIHNTVTDMPIDNSYWIAYITGGGVYHRCITAIQVTTGKTYYMVYNSSTKTWTGWVSTADGGNAATVSGVSVVTDNSLGLHRIASGSAEADDTNCPAGGWYGHHV